MRYRSLFEKQLFILLDNDPEVVSYKHEPFYIPYIMDKKTRHYIPDVLIMYTDGSCKLVEIKPFWKIKSNEVQLKKEAAIKYCKANGIERGYEIWSEYVLFPNRKHKSLTNL
jgi:hypothetical protein